MRASSSSWATLAMVVAVAASCEPAADSAPPSPAMGRDTSSAEAAPSAAAPPSSSPGESKPPVPARNTSEHSARGAKETQMVRIEGGIFVMGAPMARGNPEEKPPHEAIVASFWLDRTEVRQADYQRCVGADRCGPQRPVNPFCNAKLADRGNHPANCVDLRQADAYCRWAGKRLPTEREWEYAAGGGARHQRYSWGEQEPSPERACYYHAGGTCPVASFAPGAFGLYDMTGNVWEWTASEFVPYPSHATPDPIVATKRYVYRGGSWSRRFPKWMTNLLRNRYRPDELSAAIGARCAKSIEPLRCPTDTDARGDRCVRVRGRVLCEPGYQHDGHDCRPMTGEAAHTTAAVRGSPLRAPVADGAAAGTTSHPAADAPPDAAATTISRSRTPKYDPDCRKYWPGTPASYLFRGGPNFPSRKPALKAAGCKPRDMGSRWTSACCPS